MKLTMSRARLALLLGATFVAGASLSLLILAITEEQLGTGVTGPALSVVGMSLIVLSTLLGVSKRNPGGPGTTG